MTYMGFYNVRMERLNLLSQTSWTFFDGSNILKPLFQTYNRCGDNLNVSSRNHDLFLRAAFQFTQTLLLFRKEAAINQPAY